MNVYVEGGKIHVHVCIYVCVCGEEIKPNILPRYTTIQCLFKGMCMCEP